MYICLSYKYKYCFINVTAEDPIPYLTPKVCDADQIIVTVDWHQSIVVLHDRGQISRRGLLMDKGLNQAGLADHPIPHDRAADGQIRYNHGDSGPGGWWMLEVKWLPNSRELGIYRHWIPPGVSTIVLTLFF